jgi:hypothetical protein
LAFHQPAPAAFSFFRDERRRFDYALNALADDGPSSAASAASCAIGMNLKGAHWSIVAADGFRFE